MSNNKEPYSYHIFLFPFRWDFCKDAENDKENNFANRTSLKEFHKLLDTDNRWNPEEYKLIDSFDYNEHTYFYDFVREAIFDTKIDKTNKDKILNHYSYRLPNDDVKYSIKLLGNDKEDEKYKLNVKDIYLHVYSTGVALLSFHLANYQTGEFEDILKINEYGRRIYPQFLDASLPFTKKIKKAFLADEIEIIGIENTKEDFSYFNDGFCNLGTKNSFRLPSFIKTLLGDSFVTETENRKIVISPLVDDRMFVISWYGNNAFVNRFKTKDPNWEKHFYNKHEKGKTYISSKYNYQTNTDWYRYLFIDGGAPMCQNPDMLEGLLKTHSYARFIDLGTMYGVSRYSFVGLTSDLQTLKENNADFIPTHIKTMYYQMVVLSLMQRASILRFSDEVKEISKLDDNADEQLQEIKSLNKAYLKFTNQMYFREVTAQEEGIELYDMIQQQMRIERDVKDLNREIDELYQFARLLEDERERKQMNRISIGGAILLLPALIAGIFGMNTIGSEYLNVCEWPIEPNFRQSLLAIAILTIVVLVVVFLFHKIIKVFHKHKKSK